MSMKIRPVQWRSSHLRPVFMPAVRCPIVHQYGADGIAPEWMSLSHCLACAHCHKIDLQCENESGEVQCKAGDT